MFYLIQTNLFRNDAHDELIRNVDRMGLEYETCEYDPHIDRIDFETERRDVFCFGAIKMARCAKEYGFEPGSMFNDNHDFKVYGPKYGREMLNHDSVFMNYGDELPDGLPFLFFARPTEDTKSFSGQVFTHDSWKELRYNYLTGEVIPGRPTANTRVIVSPRKDIMQEVRCWVVGGRVVTTSQYRIGNRAVYKNMDHERDILEYAQRMVDIYQPAEAFVIDVCRTDEGLRVVEINCINCSGMYHMNTQVLLNALEQHFGA